MPDISFHFNAYSKHTCINCLHYQWVLYVVLNVSRVFFSLARCLSLFLYFFFAIVTYRALIEDLRSPFIHSFAPFFHIHFFLSFSLRLWSFNPLYSLSLSLPLTHSFFSVYSLLCTIYATCGCTMTSFQIIQCYICMKSSKKYTEKHKMKGKIERTEKDRKKTRCAKWCLFWKLIWCVNTPC